MTEIYWFSKKQGKKWLCIFLAVFVNLAFILGILLGLESLWGEMNYYIGDAIGAEFNYSLILILLILLPMIYCGILVIHNIRRLIKIDRITPNLAHKIASIALLVLFDLIIIILIVLFGKDAVNVSSMFENISIFLYLAVFIGLFISLYAILDKLKRSMKHPGNGGKNKRGKASLIIATICIGYLAGFSLPFLFPAVNVISGNLPTKPKIIAHRGAAHIAPENTIIAGQVAVTLSVDGWEIDVQVSRDGIPFIIHDDTLKRTTNVSEEFPGRENEHSSNFTWAELQRLNAGSWFVNKDPYRAIAKGLVTQEQIALFHTATIPSLEEAVNFTRDNGILLDVDFKGIPSWHPNYTTYFNICLSVLKAGGIDDQIWIATGNTNWLNQTQIEAPNMTTALSIEYPDLVSVSDFLTTGYNITNMHHGLPYDLMRSYVAAGVPINMWTIDSIWRFSQLWCLGITFVVTNEPHKFVGLLQPNWYLHTEIYTLFWIVIYLLGLSFIAVLKYGSKTKPTS